MGAGVPLKVIVTPEKVVGSEPSGLTADNTPWTPGKIPMPRMVASPPGEMPVFGSKLAPFTIVMLEGPGSCAVRLKVTLKVEDVALIVIAPAVAPAVTVVDACPVESVITEEEPSVTTPEVTTKFTWVPETPLPFESTTLTVSGSANAVLIVADC